MVDHGAVPRVYFSGGKSFHVYADFEPFRSRDPGAVAAEWARRFAREVSEAVGRPVEFDLEVVRALHMSRLPFFPRADLKGTPIPVDLMSMPIDAIKKISYSWEAEPRPDALPRPEVRLSAGMWLALLRVWEEVGDPEEVAGPPEAGGREPPRGGRIGWIEAVLRTPFEDGRKRLVALVLGPYLRRVRGVGEADAARALVEWLQMSGAADLEHMRLARARARSAGDVLPMSRARIRKDYPDLYGIIRAKVPEIEAPPRPPPGSGGTRAPTTRRRERIPEDEV
jgi:hypothetical protein